VHAWRECTKRKFQYCLGFFSIFIVVVVAAVCFTMVTKAPALFLQQAEGEGGQVDLRIVVGEASDAAFLNYTTIERLTNAFPTASYSAPRYGFAASSVVYSPACTAAVLAAGVTEGVTSIDDPAPWMYVGDPRLGTSEGNCGPSAATCLEAVCSELVPDSTRSLATRVIAIDSARERRMGLGRDWPYGKIPPGEVLIGSNIAEFTGAAAGDTLFLHLSDSSARASLLKQYLTIALTRRPDQAEVDEYLPHDAALVWDAAANTFGRTLLVPVRVAGVIASFKNKFSSDDRGSLIVMELETMLDHVTTHLHPALSLRNITELAERSQPVYETRDLKHQTLPWSPAEVVAQASLPVQEFTSEVSINLPPERVETYLTSNYDELQKSVITFATEAIFVVGFTEVDIDTPILDEVRPLRFFSLFLGLILSIILTILFVLSFMLIDSLLMISIETRTFELGVHRMTGLTRTGIVSMLLVQAASYAIPSWALGMIVSQVVCVAVVNMLSSSVEVPMTSTLTPTSIIVATVLGLLIPIVAAILPIRDALSKNLHDTLDTRHSKTLGVSFNIERSDDGTISPTALVVGVGLVVFGFLIYYLLPLSLLSLNLSLFFNIFFGILVGLLFGLIMLSLNFEHLVERLVVFLFFFWELRSIPQVVLKNLVSHRMRNRKTTIMYALSLGFVIFITVAYTTEIESAKATSIKSEGAQITFKTSRARNEIPFSAAASLEALLNAHPDVVKDWAWISRDVNYLEQFTDVVTSNAGHYYEHGVSVHALSPSYNDVGYSQYYVPTMEDRSTGLSAAEQLYTVRGSQSMMISQGIALQLNLRTLDGRSPFLLNAQAVDAGTLQMMRFKPMSTINAGPALAFTARKQSGNYPVAMSLPAYITASGGAYTTVEDVLWEKVMVSLKAGASADALARFKRAARSTAASLQLSYFDASSTSESLDSTRAMLDLIFSIATYIAMFLCLFSLIASMYSNIYESAKEIGVMRAIGLTTFQVTRIFVYEAFTLVLASSLLGIIIGFIMGWTMLLQRILFVNLPIPFIFPWINLIIVFAAAIICSFLASWGPIRAITRKTIASAFRTIM